MMHGRDIIVVSLQDFDTNIGSNCKDLAYEFARHNRVLYVNHPLDRFTLWRERKFPKVIKRRKIMRGKEPKVVKVTDNLWNLYPDTILESISRLKINWLFDILNRINNNRQAKEINEAIKILGFKDIIIFNDTDVFRSFYIKELIGAKTYVYYTRDNMIALNYWKTQGIRIEAALMSKADLVVANSTYLAGLAKKFNPHSYYVGQGCDVSHFNKKFIKSVPDDMKDIKNPAIGYIGVLYTMRLDIDVLVHIARNRHDWSLVLVGPEDEGFKNSELHQIENVHFLGRKNIDDLPAYLNAFDVALNPQKLNEITRGNYPRKIDEYLAMGKPVVATKTDAMDVFSDYVYLAENKEEHVKLIEKALQENTPNKETEREKLARSHTWEANADEIYKRIEEIEKQK